MPRVAKYSDTEALVAHLYVAAPAYSITVATTGPSDVLPAGWVYVAEDITHDDLIPPWVQPAGAHDAYPLDAQVVYGEKAWVSLIDANVWQPGISGWREATSGDMSPAWVQPTGAHDAYAFGFTVSHNGSEWRTTREANVWEPGTFDAGWTKIIKILPSETPATWVDTGATVAQLVGAGTYRVSAVPSELTIGQPLRLGDTEAGETAFSGYWPTAETPSNYITISPHVTADVGAKVWAWA